MVSQAKEEAVDVKLWRKRHAAARVKREFRTADEVLQEAAEKPAGATRQTILDMRGPQVQTRLHPQYLPLQPILLNVLNASLTATTH